MAETNKLVLPKHLIADAIDGNEYIMRLADPKVLFLVTDEKPEYLPHVEWMHNEKPVFLPIDINESGDDIEEDEDALYLVPIKDYSNLEYTKGLDDAAILKERMKMLNSAFNAYDKIEEILLQRSEQNKKQEEEAQIKGMHEGIEEGLKDLEEKK